MGDMLAALPTDPCARQRHQTAVTLLVMLRSELRRQSNIVNRL